MNSDGPINLDGGPATKLESMGCDIERVFAVVDWYRAGSKLIGGYCRTAPTDIAAMRKLS